MPALQFEHRQAPCLSWPQFTALHNSQQIPLLMGLMCCACNIMALQQSADRKKHTFTPLNTMLHSTHSLHTHNQHLPPLADISTASCDKGRDTNRLHRQTEGRWGASAAPFPEMPVRPATSQSPSHREKPDNKYVTWDSFPTTKR
jgi:hypothetical protein